MGVLAFCRLVSVHLFMEEENQGRSQLLFSDLQRPVAMQNWGLVNWGWREGLREAKTRSRLFLLPAQCENLGTSIKTADKCRDIWLFFELC